MPAKNPNPNPNRPMDAAPVPMPAPEIRVATYDSLQADCRKTLEVLVHVEPTVDHPAGVIYKIPAIRLTPREESWVTLELDRAMPEVKADGTFNLSDPTYRSRAEAQKVRARAMALCLGVPLLTDRLPDVVSRLRGARDLTSVPEADMQAMVELVQGWSTEAILTVLYAAVMPETSRAEASAVSFFSRGGYQPSS